MHPYHHHREHQGGHRRVGEILKAEPSESMQHSKRPAFSKVTSKTAAEGHDALVSGKGSAKRFARGGKVKGHKGHQTNIAIVVPHGNPAVPNAPAAGPLAGPAVAGPAPSPMRPPMPPGAPPPGAGGPPPGMPPGMPMRARGGRTGIDGESTKGDLKKWSKRASANSYAKGGLVMKAGAMSGEGRLEKARKS